MQYLRAALRRAAPSHRVRGWRLGLACAACLASAGATADARAEKPRHAKARPAAPTTSSFSSDPAGHASAVHWVFDVRADKGEVGVERAASVRLARPAPSARLLGRFALELWIGKELLDRVRFSPPLMGDETQRRKKRLFAKPSFDRVTAAFKVTMADHPRATQLVLVDRQTGKTRKFWWPPEKDGKLLPFAVPVGVVAGPLPALPKPEPATPGEGAPSAAKGSPAKTAQSPAKAATGPAKPAPSPAKPAPSPAKPAPSPAKPAPKAPSPGR